MTDTMCAETTFYGWHSHPCSRKAGFGKDGAYCKQHAAKHPSDATPTFVLWYVGQYDRVPQRIECQSQTDVMMVTIKGDRLKKNTYYSNTYETFDEAREALLGRARAGLKTAQESIDLLTNMKEPTS